MIGRIRAAFAGLLLAPLAPLAACSSDTPVDGAPDASTDSPTDTLDAATCGPADDGHRPFCPLGPPCGCDDSHFASPICVSDVWVCPPGSTEYYTCIGVPPASGDPRCSGDGGDGGDAGDSGRD